MRSTERLSFGRVGRAIVEYSYGLKKQTGILADKEFSQEQYSASLRLVDIDTMET